MKGALRVWQHNQVSALCLKWPAGTLEFLRWFQLDSEDSLVLSSASVAVCAIGGWDGNQNLRTIELISPGDTDWRVKPQLTASSAN